MIGKRQIGEAIFELLEIAGGQAKIIIYYDTTLPDRPRARSAKTLREGNLEDGQELMNKIDKKYIYN